MPLNPIFSESSIEKLTGLSRQTLSRWRKDGIFQPTDDLRWAPTRFSWAYSLEDAVDLRIMATLRREHLVPLDELRTVFARLTEMGESAWTRRLWVVDRRVRFDEPSDDESTPAVVIDIGEVRADLERDAAELRRRDPATHGKVTRNRYVNRNKWTVAGTGVMTGSIRRLTEDGYSVSDILREYPVLVPADVEAALEHERTLLGRAA